WRFSAKDISESLKDLILQDIKVKVHQCRILMGLLKALRIKGYRKAVYRIGQHASDDSLSLRHLGKKNVDWPNWITSAITKFDKEHFTTNKLIDLRTFHFSVIPSCILRPNVSLLFNAARNLDIGWIVSGENPFESH